MFGFTNKLLPARKRPARKANFRPQIEALEDRAVPTIVFRPQFGPETPASGSSFHGLNHPAVNLVFSGSYWYTAQGQQDEATLIDATKSILSGPYLSGLSQYNCDGTAHMSKIWNDHTTIALDDSNGDPKGGTLQNYLNNTIRHHNADPGIHFSEYAPIYAVISDPASSAGNDGGGNARGWYWKWHIIPETMHMIWIGTAVDSSSHVSKDNFTWTLSHELAETISDPTGTSGGFRVNPPADLPKSIKGDDQICDNEPDAGYLYRLNGELVEAYWSWRDQVYIVPDGNKQKFELVPIWNADSFTGKFDLNVTGDQLGANYADNIVIGDPSQIGQFFFPASVTMNGESASFDAGTINAINVNTAGGSNNVQVAALPFGVTLNLDSYVLGSNDSIVLGANGSLLGINSTVNISNHSGQSSVFINDTQDKTGEIVINNNSLIFSGTNATINYDDGYLDPAGNPHGVTALTIDEPPGNIIYADSVGAMTDTSVNWQPFMPGPRGGRQWLQGPAASQVHVIGPSIEA
jgi:hypothetical protein